MKIDLTQTNLKVVKNKLPEFEIVLKDGIETTLPLPNIINIFKNMLPKKEDEHYILNDFFYDKDNNEIIIFQQNDNPENIGYIITYHQKKRQILSQGNGKPLTLYDEVLFPALTVCVMPNMTDIFIYIIKENELKKSFRKRYYYCFPFGNVFSENRLCKGNQKIEVKDFKEKLIAKTIEKLLFESIFTGHMNTEGLLLFPKLNKLKKYDTKINEQLFIDETKFNLDLL